MLCIFKKQNKKNQQRQKSTLKKKSHFLYKHGIITDQKMIQNGRQPLPSGRPFQAALGPSLVREIAGLSLRVAVLRFKSGVASAASRNVATGVENS